ncbi:acylphosphatase [Ilyomonas limi]|uniref:acylphosphatase n=1 Tax=Ilyomonas limi TaxID=2575867 RepID=A0A4U3L4W1_9BACT|nr:acylphosphatase [Ilyomonas limi]TKK70188.1 acylphosphatase [Ilyomonas limi]
MPTVHLLIKGKVQGVFYRKTAKEIAETEGITGWVRNTGNGDVEVMAGGSEEALQAFIDWCHVGPVRAKVESVAITHVPDQLFETFEVKHG